MAVLTNTNLSLNSAVETKQSKNISYVAKDFESFKNELINFAKVYYPDSYKDFNESSVGMMFIELISGISDVLAFNIDAQFRELFLNTAIEKKNILKLANKILGYKIKGKVPASVYIDMYIVVPAILVGATYIPDDDYAFTVLKGTKLSSSTKTPVYFETESDVDFSQNTLQDSREQIIYEYDGETGLPTKFLLKKVVKATAGSTEIMYYSVDTPQKFLDIKIPYENVVDIVDIYDADGRQWYEVDYLAQDTIFKSVPNTSGTDPILSTDSDQVPYLLKLLNVPRRFITERDENGYLHIRFGSGISYNIDEEIFPNPWYIELPISGSETFTSTAIDPENFISTRTLGMSPYNTTLTIRYRSGEGVSTNVPSNTINTIIQRSYTFITDGLDSDSVSDTLNSLAVNNPSPAFGGKNEETIDELKNFSSAYFAAQDRVVTRLDYIVRTYSMPSKFGSIAKAFALPANSGLPNAPITEITYEPISPIVDPNNPGQAAFASTTGSNTNTHGDSLKNYIRSNPLCVNLYVLAYNSDMQLTTGSTALKENLKNYLNKFRIITDGVNIIDGNTINIGIKYKVMASPQYNKHEVLQQCNEVLKNFFDIRKMQFNQPIIYSELYKLLQDIVGISSVSEIEITNLYGTNYSDKIYDIKANTYNGILYPSKDVSIFEIKFPESDIRGICL